MGIETKEYFKVKTDGIFDLAEFAKEYNMTPDEVVKFHNKYCDLRQLLSLNLSKYVDSVYLPLEKYTERQTKIINSSNIEFPDNNTDKKYGIVIKFSSKELQLHYQIKVKRNYGAVELTKEKTYVNNNKVDQVIEQLFEKSQNALFPLKLLLKRNGEIEKIINEEEIKERWQKEISPNLKTYYQSETTDEILKHFDEIFSNISKKSKLLERNIFYKLFFMPIYRTYSGFKSQDKLQIYFSDLARYINYTIEYDLKKEFTRGDKIALKLNGAEDENLLNENSEKGKIEFLYKIDKDTKDIYSIEGFISAFHEDKEHKINFQLYELKN